MLRRARPEDEPFLRLMLYEAATPPDAPRQDLEDVLAEPRKHGSSPAGAARATSGWLPTRMASRLARRGSGSMQAMSSLPGISAQRLRRLRSLSFLTSEAAVGVGNSLNACFEKPSSRAFRRSS